VGGGVKSPNNLKLKKNLKIEFSMDAVPFIRTGTKNHAKKTTTKTQQNHPPVGEFVY
jgi:hypothetical protein